MERKDIKKAKTLTSYWILNTVRSELRNAMLLKKVHNILLLVKF